jgi:hypothetical protein
MATVHLTGNGILALFLPFGSAFAADGGIVWGAPPGIAAGV